VAQFAFVPVRCDFLIDIPCKENISLEHVGSMWAAVSILMRGVIDSGHHWLG
jgi:hypothetical protein